MSIKRIIVRPKTKFKRIIVKGEGKKNWTKNNKGKTEYSVLYFRLSRSKPELAWTKLERILAK